ncbi:matrilin-4-like [Haliotis cracherodii]|uniref:matrilin-4-like n=1 Tax=Haliotis cracherodii TaxID=6455 RepID=UPI0039ECB491
MLLGSFTLVIMAFIAIVHSKPAHHKRHEKAGPAELFLGPGCGGKPAEFFFLLDTSSSIWEPDFKTQLKFVTDVVDMFDIGPNNTRVGVATFSSYYYPQFGLDRYEDKEQLKQAILRIPYMGGNTLTGTAIRYMREKAFAPQIVREGIDKIAIVLTDGKSRNPPQTESEAMKTKMEGINIFAVGIGDRFDYKELTLIGSEPSESFVFEVASYGALESIMGKLALGACEAHTAEAIMQGDQSACHSDSLADVMFVFDSAAMGSTKTGQIQEFIGTVVDEFNFADDVMRAGVVSRNCHDGDIELGEHSDKDEFAKDLRNRDFPELSQVVRKMHRHSFTLEQGAREMARRMAVVFVDDKLEIPKRVFHEIEKAKDDDIEIFVVAIGEDVDMTEVEVMATSAGHVFQIADYDALRETNLQLIDVLCAVGLLVHVRLAQLHHLYTVISTVMLPEYFIIACLAIVGLVSSKPAHTGTFLTESDQFQQHFGPGCGGKPAEFFFLLDTSSSIWEPDFKTQLKFVTDVVDMFDIGPNNTRVGVATFSSYYYPQFGLDRYEDKEQLKQAILRIPYMGGNTLTGTAIRYMREKAFAPQIVREGIDKIAIVLTDGKSRNPPKTESEAMKTKMEGINIFAVGIGDRFDYKELTLIGSEPSESFVFEVASYGALESIMGKLALGACEANTAEAIMQGDQPACHSDSLADVMFVFDSAATGSTKTGQIQEFIGTVVDEFNFADDVMRAGVVSRNCHDGDIELGEHADKDEFAKDLRNRDFPELSQVVRKMHRHSFTLEQGAREMARRMAVVFVDDKLEIPKRVFHEIEESKKENIEIFVVAIGEDVDMTEVEVMATSAGHVFQIADYDALRETNLQLIDVLCADL